MKAKLITSNIVLKCLSSPETNFVFKTFNLGVLIYLQMQILLTFVIYIFVSVLRIKKCKNKKQYS